MSVATIDTNTDVKLAWFSWGKKEEKPAEQPKADQPKADTAQPAAPSAHQLAQTEAKQLATKLWQGYVPDAPKAAADLRALIAKHGLELNSVLPVYNLKPKEAEKFVNDCVANIAVKHDQAIYYARRIYESFEEPRFSRAKYSLDIIRQVVGDIGKDLSILDATGSKSAETIDAELTAILQNDEYAYAEKRYAMLMSDTIRPGFGSAVHVVKDLRENLQLSGKTLSDLDAHTDPAVLESNLAAAVIRHETARAQDALREASDPKSGKDHKASMARIACTILADQGLTTQALATADADANSIEQTLNCPAVMGTAKQR